MQKKSLFIVIEGLDGSGKTSVSRHLAQVLNAPDKDIVKLTYEPNNDCVAGAFIRDILTKKYTGYTPEILALAFATNRLDHCDRVVKPWLSASDDHIVISDRYYLSSMVYQSSPTFSFHKVMTFNQFALKPDIIFFIDVDDKVCYQRMANRNMPPELFETKLAESRRKFLKGIQFLKEKRRENIINIDGNGTIESVAGQILTAIYNHAPYFKRD